MLPSQNREGRDRRYMYHRGRPSRLIVLAVGATLLVAGGSWWFSRDKADEADPGDPPVVVSDDSEGVGQSPLGTPEASLDRSDSVLTELPTPAEARAEPPAAAPKPREITMGRPADLGAAEEPAVETDASTRDAARVMHRPPRPAGNGRAVLSDRVPADVRRVADTALALVDTDPVLARTMLTQVLLDPAIGRRDAATLRETLTMLSDRLVFSAECMPGDPFSIECSVRSGDSLSRIKSRYGLQIEWSLLKRVNGIQDERRLQVGQRLKLVTGPFHAVIDKSDYRMDIYLGPS
ncbi:MAG: LysM peptidoglycan-binding domain-containing protein, partial [Planctomycetota bacterium]